MKHARIQDGIVVEFIEPFWEGEREVPIVERFPAQLVAHLVEVPDAAAVSLGDTHDGNAFGPPPAPPAPTEAAVRAERERLLNMSDWTQLRDVPAETAGLWAPYRQALRDVPSQDGFPETIEWPTPPQGA